MSSYLIIKEKETKKTLLAMSRNTEMYQAFDQEVGLPYGVETNIDKQLLDNLTAILEENKANLISRKQLEEKAFKFVNNTTAELYNDFIESISTCLEGIKEIETLIAQINLLKWMTNECELIGVLE